MSADSQEKKSPNIVRYEATTSLLNTILLALEKTVEDQSWWKIRTDIAFLCLLEMTTFVTDKPSDSTRNERLILWSLELAIPHVREMAVAMVRSDRPGAIRAGTVAFERLTTCQQHWIDPVCIGNAGHRTETQQSRTGAN
jgi:hypothetical protein